MCSAAAIVVLVWHPLLYREPTDVQACIYTHMQRPVYLCTYMYRSVQQCWCCTRRIVRMPKCRYVYIYIYRSVYGYTYLLQVGIAVLVWYPLLYREPTDVQVCIQIHKYSSVYVYKYSLQVCIVMLVWHPLLYREHTDVQVCIFIYSQVCTRIYVFIYRSVYVYKYLFIGLYNNAGAAPGVVSRAHRCAGMYIYIYAQVFIYMDARVQVYIIELVWHRLLYCEPADVQV